MPEQDTSGPHPLLILIHGRGADEEDLLGLSPLLDPRLMLLSVRAPLPFEGGGYTWYALAGPVGQPDHATFMASYQALRHCVRDALTGYPVDPTRVFLLGFSMGAVMSLTMALTEPAWFRGIAAHSGYVPEGVPLGIHRDAVSGPPVFIAHGLYDPIIPVGMARTARRLFGAENERFRYREYPIGHEISEESIADIREWMRPLMTHESNPGER